jgi:aminopeptidase Y
MYNILSLIALSSLAGASIIQQQPLILSEAPLISSAEQLISSEALEAHITKEGLLKRAKHLYKIAEQGIPEYNHPTRVIGSQGALQLLVLLGQTLLTAAVQDTSRRSTTFTRPLRALETFMRSATSPSVP